MNDGSPPPISYHLERLHLEEMYDLCVHLRKRLERLRRISRRWKAADGRWAQMTETAGRPEYDNNAFIRLSQRVVHYQSDAWLEIEGFLATWARLSLILFPSRDTYEPRGAYLRDLLRVENESVFAKRGVRDKWMHFDERLDVLERDGVRLGRQGFRRSESRPPVIRWIDLERARVGFHGVGEIDLAAIVKGADELRVQVLEAGENLVQRRLAEIRAEHGGDDAET